MTDSPGARLDVEEVTAMTHRSEASGADITDAMLVKCSGGRALASGCSMCFSGGASWPGNEHGDEATGKLFDIKMFGAYDTFWRENGHRFSRA
jgi:hypothetical protein